MYLSPSTIVCGYCSHDYQAHVDGYSYIDVPSNDTEELVEVYCERDPLNLLAEDHNLPVTFLNGDQWPIAHGDYDYYSDTLLTLKDADLSNKYLTDANPFAFVEDEHDTTAPELDKSSRYVDYIEEATEYDPYARNDYLWAAARYTDKHPHEFTSATHAWKRTLNTDPFGAPDSTTSAVYTYPTGCAQAVGSLPNALNVTEGQTRNAYWLGEEGVDAGHLVIKVIDPHLTELYHNRLLNIFNDKRTGALRCGGLELTKADGHVTAKCVNSKCSATLKCRLDGIDLPGLTPTEVYEEFVYAVIRHGNNHAASWFTKRDSFYKVHSTECDLTCDPKVAHCSPVTTESRVA